MYSPLAALTLLRLSFLSELPLRSRSLADARFACLLLPSCFLYSLNWPNSCCINSCILSNSGLDNILYAYCTTPLRGFLTNDQLWQSRTTTQNFVNLGFAMPHGVALNAAGGCRRFSRWQLANLTNIVGILRQNMLPNCVSVLSQ